MRLTGFEPAVYGLKARCHSAWLQTQYHILFMIFLFSLCLHDIFSFFVLKSVTDHDSVPSIWKTDMLPITPHRPGTENKGSACFLLFSVRQSENYPN